MEKNKDLKRLKVTKTVKLPLDLVLWIEKSEGKNFSVQLENILRRLNK
jgi:hypothetical protein